MTISTIKQLLETSDKPVARALFHQDHFRVLAIGFKKDMILKDHKTPYESKLVALEGNVIYKQDDQELVLHQYEECIIPLNVIHSVVALEDALCLLIQC